MQAVGSGDLSEDAGVTLAIRSAGLRRQRDQISHLLRSWFSVALSKFCHPLRDLRRLCVLPPNRRLVGIAAQPTARPMRKLVRIAAALGPLLVASPSSRPQLGLGLAFLPVDLLPPFPAAVARPIPRGVLGRPMQSPPAVHDSDPATTQSHRSADTPATPRTPPTRSLHATSPTAVTSVAPPVSGVFPPSPDGRLATHCHSCRASNGSFRWSIATRLLTG